MVVGEPTADAQLADSNVTVWATLRRDIVFLVAVPLLLLSLIPSVFPILSEDARYLYADAYADLPLLLLIIVAFQVGLRALEGDHERRFWNLWTAGFSIWVGIRILFVAMPVEVQNHQFDVLIDLLYCCFYLCLVVAVDLETGPTKRPRDTITATTTAGTVIVGVGLLGYFAVIPSAINPENYATWVPSLILYTLLDLYLLYRLSRLCRKASDPRWRRVYGWLAVTAALWAVTDAMEALSWAEAIPWFWPGGLFDLPWFLPLMTVIIAARVRTHGLSTERAEDPSLDPARPLPARFWGGSLAVYAFGLAIVHMAVEAMGLMDAATRMARNIWVLSILGILVAFAVRRERLLERTARETTAREFDLQQQLRQVRKMEALGRLAGGVAHDFNNILLAIVGYGELAKENTPEDTENAEYLDAILRGADRATHLVRRITTFSRHDVIDSHPVEIVPIVRDALELLRATLPSTIELREELDEQSGRVLGDPDHLYQALINLGANAADAMGDEGGVLTVRVEPIATAGALPKPMAVARPEPYVLLTVSDTGRGMEPDVVEKIFEPFFTTKDAGVGLGLSAVHAIATHDGGGIRVDSEPGIGTTFRLCLASISTTAAIPTQAEPEVDLSGSERILVVDDEPALVELAEQQLGRLGYVVTTATDPDEALDQFRRLPEHFDLLITDQTMPGRTGLQLAEAIREIRPDLPILLTTGYSEVVTPESTKAAGIDIVILKPFHNRAIAGAIREVLDARGVEAANP